jgi:hypothetical protein
MFDSIGALTTLPFTVLKCWHQSESKPPPEFVNFVFAEPVVKLN